MPGVNALYLAFMYMRAPGASLTRCVWWLSIPLVSPVSRSLSCHRSSHSGDQGRASSSSSLTITRGEHLPSAQKESQQRGFFHWKHSKAGYCPVVKNFPRFAGQEWEMQPVVAGFPQQTANLKEFSRRFHFQWFYN